MNPRSETKLLLVAAFMVAISIPPVAFWIWKAHSHHTMIAAKDSEESLLAAAHIATELSVALCDDIISCPFDRMALADLRPNSDSPHGLNRSELQPETDVWGQRWFVRCENSGLEVRSAGRDGLLDTEDDPVDQRRVACTGHPPTTRPLNRP